jgi:plastocyanin domain-containing protein
MVDWLVNLSGAALIAAIAWWFWLSRPRAVRLDRGAPIEILVADGVYTPKVVEVASGSMVVLRFLRKDPTPCAEKVVFGDLDVTVDLPLNEPREVRLVPPAPGEYEFTCQMGMYRGKLVAG